MHRTLLTTPRIGGLLLAVVLGTAWATADEYSGLRDPNMAAASDRYRWVSRSVVRSFRARRPGRCRATGRTHGPGGAPAGVPGHGLSSGLGRLGELPFHPGTSESSSTPPAQPSRPRLVKTRRILARVGSEVVLTAEAMAYVVREVFDPTSGIHGTQPSQLTRAAWAILNAPEGQVPRSNANRSLRAGVNVAVETKLLYLDARRSSPQRELSQRRKAVGQDLRGDANCPSCSRRRRFDRDASWTTSFAAWALRWSGRSGSSWSDLWRDNRMHGSVKFEEPITHDALLAYYDDHLADYEHPTRARWEQISVRVSKYPEQGRGVAPRWRRLGDQVQDGVPFAEVARRGSDGVTAAQGGAAIGRPRAASCRRRSTRRFSACRSAAQPDPRGRSRACTSSA